ncbi:DUF6545 domain-containing protein [Streptomyces jumonjinensis]
MGDTQLLCLFGLLLGASMAVLAPASMTAVDRVLPELSHLAHLLGRGLEMMALALLPPAVSHLAPPGRWEARRVTHLRATAAVLTVCPLLFLAAGADLSGGRVVADGPGRLALAAFGLVFICFSLWCLWGFTPQVHRYAWDLPPGPLRTGLRLITTGAVLGGLWGLWGLAGVGNVMLHQGQGAGQDPVAVALVRDAELALYQQVIEIHDGYLTLRPHLPPHFPHWAEEGFPQIPRRPVRRGGRHRSGGRRGGAGVAALGPPARRRPGRPRRAAGRAGPGHGRRGGGLADPGHPGADALGGRRLRPPPGPHRGGGAPGEPVAPAAVRPRPSPAQPFRLVR